MKPIYKINTDISTLEQDIAAELAIWFSVDGDMDDFIYFGGYGEPEKERSEK